MAQANPEFKYYRQLAGTWKNSDGSCVVVLTEFVGITVSYGGAVLDGNYGVTPTGPSVELHPRGAQGRSMPDFMTYRYDPSEDIQLKLGDRALKDGGQTRFNIDFAWHDDTDRLHLDLSNVITGEKLSFILDREVVSASYSPLKEGECRCDCGQIFASKFCPNCGAPRKERKSTYIIREALPDDAEKMISYLNQVGGESDNLLHGENEFKVPVEGVKRKLAMSKESENSIVLIALENEQIIARAELDGYYPARIRHRAKFGISVRKDYWNQGIGTEMLKRIFEQAKEMKIRIIELEVISDNLRGINLYHKMGFVDIGIYKAYFNVNGTFKDAIVMQKIL